jgi:PAS domain S-box-containing protein
MGSAQRIAKIRTAVKEPAKMPTRKLPAGRQIGNATQPAHRVGVGEAAADYLRENRLALNALFDVSPVAKGIFDSNGRMVLINKAALKLFGVSDVADLDSYNFFGNPSMPKDTLQRLSGGETVSFQAQYDFEKVRQLRLYKTSRRGTAELEFLFTALPPSGKENVGGYLVVVQDITDRRRAEELLHDSEDRYRQLFNGISDAVFLHGIRDDGLPGVFVEVNDVACERLGYSREELLRMGPLDIDAPEGIAAIPRTMAGMQRDGRVTWEGMHVTKDGRKIPVEISTVKFFLHGSSLMLSTVRDIAARKQVEAELRQALNHWSVTFNAMNDAICLLDREGTILQCNQSMRDMLGVGSDVAVGRKCYEVMHNAGTFLADCPHRKMMQTRKRESVDLVLGDKCYTESAEPVFDAAGELCGAVHVIHDVTDIKQVERQLYERSAELSHANRVLRWEIKEHRQSEAARDALRTELAHASRLAAMGELATGIAHEINQPLSIVATWAEVALREIREKLGEDGKEAILSIERIAGAMERAGQIIRHMKSFARKTDPRVTTVALAEALDEVLPLVENRLRMSGTTLHVGLDRATALVLADRIQVQQVLLNLIVNGIEAMENGEAGNRRVSITAERRDDMLEVAVIDSGDGISPDQLANLFEPFYTSKPEGMGIGLSICRSIVESGGGTIRAVRNPGRGTTVAFTLPIAKESPSHVTDNNLHSRR